MNRPMLLSVALICFAPVAYELNKARGMDESNGIALAVTCFVFGVVGLLIGFITREKEQPRIVIDGSESQLFGLNKLKPDEKFMIVFGIIFASTWGVFGVTVKLFGIWGLLSVGIIVLVWPAAKYILPDPETQPYKEQW